MTPYFFSQRCLARTNPLLSLATVALWLLGFLNGSAALLATEPGAKQGSTAKGAEVTGPNRAAGFKDEQPTGLLLIQGDHGPGALRNIRVRPLSGMKTE